MRSMFITVLLPIRKKKIRQRNINCWLPKLFYLFTSNIRGAWLRSFSWRAPLQGARFDQFIVEFRSFYWSRWAPSDREHRGRGGWRPWRRWM